jgi:hypothetical protein
MINVTYELDGTIDEDTAARAVEKVVQYHQQALGGMTCPIHQQAPRLKVQGHSVPDLAVSVESCCPILTGKVEARIHGISRRDQA